MSKPAVVLPPLARPVDELWHVLLDLGETIKVRWTLIGGQMVLLHALAHGQVPPQISQDGDVIADIRATPSAIKVLIGALEVLGFAIEGVGPDGIAHRYIRPSGASGPPSRNVAVDVLAPDGVGARAVLTTTSPGRTVQVPGGTQALGRTERVTVIHEGRSGRVPRPTLLGAIICKAAACGLPHDPSRHLRDLALLCALIEDPFTTREDLTDKDRERLGLAAALRDDAHPAWLLVPAEIRGQGQAAYAILTERS